MFHKKKRPDDLRAKVITEEQRRVNALELGLPASGDLKSAIRYLEGVIQQDPNFARAWTYLSAAYLEVGREVEAGKSIERAIQLDPDDPVIVSLFADCTGKDNRWRIERLEEITKKNDVSPLTWGKDAWPYLAAAYVGAGRFRDAAMAARKVIDLGQGQNVGGHHLLSFLYFVAMYNAKKAELRSARELKILFEGIEDALPADIYRRLYEVPSEERSEEESQVEVHLGGCTLEALGCSYAYGREMAERHTRAVLAGAQPGSDVMQAAKDRLRTIRMMDEMYGIKGGKPQPRGGR